MASSRLAAVGLVLAGLVFGGVCYAQGDRGNITGTVTDPGGAAVPGANIKATNPATGLTQSTTTGADGNYNLQYLPVGQYRISAEKTGFSTAEQTGIAVQVSNTTRADFELRVGQVQERVEVTAAAPVVVSERSDLGTVMSSKEIIDLLRGGQTVLNIVPLAGLVSELQAAITGLGLPPAPAAAAPGASAPDPAASAGGPAAEAK